MQEEPLKGKSEEFISYICLSAFFAFLGMILFMLYSCTNVVMTHTEGAGASESLEDAQTTTPTIKIPFMK